jgi:hypothetical protein
MPPFASKLLRSQDRRKAVRQRNFFEVGSRTSDNLRDLANDPALAVSSPEPILCKDRDSLKLLIFGIWNMLNTPSGVKEKISALHRPQFSRSVKSSFEVETFHSTN